MKDYILISNRIKLPGSCKTVLKQQKMFDLHQLNNQTCCNWLNCLRCYRRSLPPGTCRFEARKVVVDVAKINWKGLEGRPNFTLDSLDHPLPIFSGRMHVWHPRMPYWWKDQFDSVPSPFFASREPSSQLLNYLYHYIFSGGLHISREAKKQLYNLPKQLSNRSLSVSIHTAYMLLVAAMIWNSLCSDLHFGRAGSVRSVIENNKARGSAAWAWHWFTIYTSKSDVVYCTPVEYSRHLLVPCLPCLPHPTKSVWAPEVLPVGLPLTLPSFGPRALVGPLGGGTIVLWIRALEMCIDVTLRPNLLVTLWC